MRKWGSTIPTVRLYLSPSGRYCIWHVTWLVEKVVLGNFGWPGIYKSKKTVNWPDWHSQSTGCRCLFQRFSNNNKWRFRHTSPFSTTRTSFGDNNQMLCLKRRTVITARKRKKKKKKMKHTFVSSLLRNIFEPNFKNVVSQIIFFYDLRKVRNGIYNPFHK